MATVTEKFKTEGMHCRSCEVLIDEGVSEIDDVSDAKSDHVKRLLVVYNILCKY